MRLKAKQMAAISNNAANMILDGKSFQIQHHTLQKSIKTGQTDILKTG